MNNKKKAIKIATATAIVASGFVAVAPAQAATNTVDKSINNAITKMQAAYDSYNKPAVKGDLPAVKTVRTAVTNAQTAYKAAVAEIKKNGGTTANKAKYTKKLNDKKFYLERAEKYVTATNINLKASKTEFDAAVTEGTQSKVLKAKKALDAKIVTFKKAVAAVYGPKVRTVLNDTYTIPAEEKTASVDKELAVYAAYKKIQDGDLIAKDIEQAGKIIADTKATVEAISKKEGKLVANILKAVKKFDDKYEAALVPTVKEVSAINGKDLEVVFSKAVDKITAETKANYEISINNATTLAAGSYTVAVDEKDTKKVHVTLADGVALDNGAYVSVKVKKAVSDTNLKPLNEDVTKTLTFVDNTAATIQTVEVDGNDLKVTFNDYVSAVGLVKVEGVTKTAVVASPYSKTVVVTNGALGLSNGTYNVQFANVEDIANIVGPGSTNATAFTSGNFTISSDTVSPLVSKVEKVDQDTFKVTFNKAVTAPTVTVKKNGLDLTPTVVATSDAKVWTVNVANNGGVLLYNDGESTVNLTANISGFKAISNNVVGDVTTQTVSLSKDTTGPVNESRFNEIVDTPATGLDEVFSLKFNEVITAADATKIVLTDKDGIRKAVTSATIVPDASGANTILQVKSSAVQTSGAINDGTYKLALGAGTVKDTANNDSAATTVTITKSGSAATDLTVTATASGNVITIPYGTPMGNSALELANYKIDNAALPAGSTVYFDGSKSTVKIELPAGSIAKTESVVLTVSPNVIAESGAKLATASRNQVVTGLVDNVKPTLVSAKKLTATTIEATFSENLAVVTDSATSQNDFVVKVNGVAFTVTAVTDGARDNKVVLTVADFNVDQNVTVTMADSAIEIADIATNTAVAKTSVTATK